MDSGLQGSPVNEQAGSLTANLLCCEVHSASREVLRGEGFMHVYLSSRLIITVDGSSSMFSGFVMYLGTLFRRRPSEAIPNS
jgi:hypothetical protein